MKPRERFQAVMGFRPFDRLPILEWAGWWDKTIARWRQEELPPELTDRYDICRHFGLEVYKQDWLFACAPECPQPTHYGAGIISTEADYDRIRPFLYPSNPVDSQKWRRWTDEQKKGDVVLWFSVEGFFSFPRRLLGIDRHFYAFYDQPDLIHRINSDNAAWISRVFDEVSSICTPDFMTFGEDMSYNHGPMLSKEHFDQFVMPYYKQVVPKLNRNIISIVDSDGDMSIPSYWYEEAGIQGILPLERQAGVNIAKLRKEHPKMRFIGHFDKMTMNKGETAIRAEFKRLLPTAAKGGFLISCDHQTPPEVSYSNYRLYISLFNEYAREAGRMSQC